MNELESHKKIIVLTGLNGGGKSQSLQIIFQKLLEKHKYSILLTFGPSDIVFSVNWKGKLDSKKENETYKTI